jgi:LacI family transcriptional regulator
MTRNVTVQEPLRIAFVSGRSVVSAAILRGLGRHARLHGLPWALITIEHESILRARSDSIGRAQAAYDGVVGFLSGPDFQTWAQSKRCPVIQYSGAPLVGERGVRITGDDVAIGTMAARHLVAQGYRSFACTGRWSIEVLARRCEAFMAELARLGHGCAVDDQDAAASSPDEPPETRLASWLRSLPRPTALFFHQDRPALYALELCAEHGLRVPQDLAILGVDDVSDACEASQPPLSSVALPWTHLGALGGLHLQRLLSGGTGGEDLRVAPLCVVPRASTARPLSDDALVVRCLRHLSRDCGQAVSIAGLAARLGVDASTLNRRLRAATGCGAGEHLHRLRIEKAQDLLAVSDAALEDLARQVGYASRQRFGAMFRRRTGMTPAEYRERVQAD